MRRRGWFAMVLVAGLAAAWLAAGPGMAEDAAGQVAVRPDPAYTPADPNMIAVADHGNERIQVFWPNGTFAFKFESEGPVDGGFNHLYDVAVGPDGRIFVVVGDGYGHSPVRVFTPDGSFLSWLGSRGGGLGQFGAPHFVDVGPDGQIVVSESGVHEPRRIQVFSPNGEFERVIASNVAYAIPNVAVGPDGQIVVGDTDKKRIQVFHPNGSIAAVFYLNDGVYPRSGLAVGPDGRIFVGAAANCDGYTCDEFIRVLHPYTPHPSAPHGALPNGTLAYSPGPPNGTLPNGTATFGPPVVLDGLPPSDYRDVAVGPNGRIVVSSADNHSVQVFHPNGSLALSFGSYSGLLRAGFDSPTDVAVGPDGQIVVAEPGSRSIQVFHPNGSLASKFGSLGGADGGFYTPAHVAVGPDGRIVVGDTDKKRIQAFRPDPNNGSAYAFDGVAFGSHGYGVRQFIDLRDVAVGPDGRIVVVDSSIKRASVFHPNGSFVLAFGLSMDQAESVAVGPDGQIFVGGRTSYAGDDVVRVFHPYTERDGTLAYSPGPPNGTLPNGTATFGPPVDVDWQAGRIADVAVGPDGRIVVAESDDPIIRAFHPDGSFESEDVVDITIAGMAVGPDGRIVAVDTSRNLVHVFEPDGSFAFSLLPSIRDGTFNRPGPVAVGPLSIPASAGPPAPLFAVIAPAVGPPAPHNFTDAGDAANVTIDVGGLAEPGAAPLNGSESSTVTFPASGAVVAASFATVSFPPNVTAAHVPAGGLLALHISANVPDDRLVLEALAPNGSGAVVLRRVVEVGGANASVVFDLPVRILLEGQAGGRAFYIAGANGTITPVDEACTADDTAEVHAQLGGSGECQMDSADGGGKIVYTYHLTRFGTAELSPAPVIPGPSPPPPTPVLPTVSPPEPAAPPVVHTCSVSLGSPNLDLRATAGGYSDPVRQALRNTGSLALEHVELGATTWKDIGPLPAPAPAPSLPPPVVGTDTGRASAVLTAVLVVGLPASVTELSTDARGAAPYAPLANGTAVARGLEGGAEEPIWFRMNLSDRGDMQGGTFVQTITYQVQCAQP